MAGIYFSLNRKAKNSLVFSQIILVKKFQLSTTFIFFRFSGLYIHIHIHFMHILWYFSRILKAVTVQNLSVDNLFFIQFRWITLFPFVCVYWERGGGEWTYTVKIYIYISLEVKFLILKIFYNIQYYFLNWLFITSVTDFIINS